MKHTFTIKPGKLGEYEKSLPRKYMAALLQAHERASKEMVKQLQDATRNAAPTHSGGPVGAVASGKLMRGWAFKLIRSDLSVVVYNTARDGTKPYDSYVEQGVKPGGRQPPTSAILKWMRAAGISAQRPRSVAFLIGRAIRRRGLRARLIVLGKSGSRLANFAKAHYRHFRQIVGQEMGKL